MALNVNNNVQKELAFQGKYARTENGTPYYKTNSGIKAGTVLAIPTAALWFSKLNAPTDEASFTKSMNKIKDIFTKNMSEAEKKEFLKGWEDGMKTNIENIKKNIERAKKQKKLAIPAAIIAVASTIGCGAIVDHLRNEKAKETADLARKIGDKNAFMQGDGVALSHKGKAYYESNEGAKWGAVLGAGCGVIHSLLNKNKGLMGIAVPAMTFALGGWLMGLITDKNSNKAASKH